MGGGLGKGELGTIVALPGYGKSTMLVNIAARALLQSKRVIYITLELSKKMIASKFDTCLFGRTFEKIQAAPKEFALALKEMRNRLTGKLIIADFPTGSLTVAQIQTVIAKMDNVDLVLVDYGQMIKPSSRRDQTRNELTETYKALRGVAGEMKVPIWTAHQANRPGTDCKVLRMEHIAEDFNVAATSDICISVNYTEEEQRLGQMRLFIMKSRIGPSFIQIECKINFKMSKITQ